MGKSGAGKSTTINALNGNKMYEKKEVRTIKKDDKKIKIEIDVIEAENPIMKIGHEIKSETIFLNAVEVEDE